MDPTKDYFFWSYSRPFVKQKLRKSRYIRISSNYELQERANHLLKMQVKDMELREPSVLAVLNKNGTYIHASLPDLSEITSGSFILPNRQDIICHKKWKDIDVLITSTDILLCRQASILARYSERVRCYVESRER